MRSARITGPDQVELQDVPTPKAHGDLVVVQVLIAPLCTEFKARATGALGDYLGHEAAGVVVDPGDSSRVSVGDRVVVMPQNGCGQCWLCQQGDHIYCPHQRDVLTESGSTHGLGTLAEYLIKPDWLLVHVPDDIRLDHAAMACCGFGPTFTAHQRMGTTALDTVLVSGCGAVGLGAISQAAALGADVLAYEVHPFRAELALKLGARTVIDPRTNTAAAEVSSLTAGRGATAGIETSGAATAARLLSDSLARRGRMAIVAWTQETVLPAVVPAGQDIFGCWHWNHQRYLQSMWTMIRRAATAIDTMITHRYPLDEVDAAMALQTSGACGKVLVFPFGKEDPS